MKPEADIFTVARQCLDCREPQLKCTLTDAAYKIVTADTFRLDAETALRPIGDPGRPERPRLVAPRDLPRRRPGSAAGRATLLHALAHIEFNAINLAWDAVYRFRGLPRQFYVEWAKVASEEALHFRLLCARLDSLGFAYGDFDAHNGLWEMACKTAHDPLVRMALVPRVLEARGLDVTPSILDKLRHSGDAESVQVLEIILRDEIGHVEIGSRWFRYLCRQRGVDPERTFAGLLDEYMQGQVKAPFHYAARRKAGFNEREMQFLETLAAAKGRS